MLDYGDIVRWTAEHDGCASPYPPTVHRRSVLLDRASRSIDIIDQIDGGSPEIRLAFRLGPTSGPHSTGLCSPGLACRVHTWSGTAGTAAWTTVELAPRRDRPISGWYAHGLGRLVRLYAPGLRSLRAGMPLITRLEFQVGELTKSAVFQQAISSIHPSPCRIGRRRSKRRPMSQKALDLRRSIQIVRRHKVLVGILVALGILGGAAYAIASLRCSRVLR